MIPLDELPRQHTALTEAGPVHQMIQIHRNPGIPASRTDALRQFDDALIPRIGIGKAEDQRMCHLTHRLEEDLGLVGRIPMHRHRMEGHDHRR